MNPRVNEFRRLHEGGCFVLPNPWDIGSARILAGLGFKAVATTSAGLAWKPAIDERFATCPPIPRSTILGISVAGVLYVLGTLVVMGVVPREQLIGSIAPFQDAASTMWGPWAGYVVSIGVIVSSIGALNGWTLLMAQVPMAAAQDGLFPPLFGRLSPRGVPAFGIVISAGLATVLLLVQVSGAPGFAAVYNLIVSLSTMAAVIPYAFCALACGLIAARDGKRLRIGVIECIAFAFSVFTLYGCGPTAVLYGLILLICGIPVFVWQQRRGRVSGLVIH